MNTRNRTPSEYIGYGLYLYFSGLSLRRTAERLFGLLNETTFPFGSGFKNTILKRYSTKRRKIYRYVIDETLIKVGSDYIWLWVTIDPKTKEILCTKYQKKGICL